MSPIVMAVVSSPPSLYLSIYISLTLDCLYEQALACTAVLLTDYGKIWINEGHYENLTLTHSPSYSFCEHDRSF
jgi:hypothetical protein